MGKFVTLTTGRLTLCSHYFHTSPHGVFHAFMCVGAWRNTSDHARRIVEALEEVVRRRMSSLEAAACGGGGDITMYKRATRADERGDFSNQISLQGKQKEF